MDLTNIAHINAALKALREPDNFFDGDLLALTEEEFGWVRVTPHSPEGADAALRRKARAEEVWREARMAVQRDALDEIRRAVPDAVAKLTFTWNPASFLELRAAHREDGSPVPVSNASGWLGGFARIDRFAPLIEEPTEYGFSAGPSDNEFTLSL